MPRKKNTKSKAAKIWTIAINTILVVFFLIGLLIAFSLLPFKNNYQVLAVMSGSMEPNIPTGSIIVVKPVNEYQVGDVITFKTPNSTKAKDFTTHRLIEIREKEGQKTYITKGDANEGEDTEAIERSSIIGKEFFSVALLGYLLGYIKTLPGLLIIIIIPAVIIVYEEINNIKKEIAKIIKQKKKLKKGYQ